MSRFATVRTLTGEGLPLSELRRALMSRGEHEAVAEAVDRLAETQEAGARALEALARRVEELEGRLLELESRRKGWFGKR